MGAAGEEPSERARALQGGRRELLLEEKRSLEAWLRQCFSWILAMGSLEVTYIGMLRALGPSPKVLLAVPLLLTVCILALGVYGLKVERRIGRIRALLRDECSPSRGLLMLALAYGLACSILALVMILA